MIAGSSASSSSQRNKQNKDQKTVSGPGQNNQKPGSPLGVHDMDKGQILGTERGELPPPPRALSDANPDLAGSRQSFRMAMGNPCEYTAAVYMTRTLVFYLRISIARGSTSSEISAVNRV